MACRQRRFFIIAMAIALTLAFAANGVAEELPGFWKLAEKRPNDGVPVTVFIETEKTTGRPAFKIETIFDVSPSSAAATIMEEMLNVSDPPDGQERKILEQHDHGALVYTFIDLPFMMADREVAVRIVHLDDPETGIHRIEWQEENSVLPEPDRGVVRLFGARGYWEFRPEGEQHTRATYLTRAEVGGSIPTSIANRLLKRQAIDAVEQLRSDIKKSRDLAKLRHGKSLPSVSLGR